MNIEDSGGILPNKETSKTTESHPFSGFIVYCGFMVFVAFFSFFIIHHHEVQPADSKSYKHLQVFVETNPAAKEDAKMYLQANPDPTNQSIENFIDSTDKKLTIEAARNKILSQ